jgi:hypothetical protein
MRNKSNWNRALFRGAAHTSTASPGYVDWWRRAVSLWGRILRLSRRAPRRLRLCESLPLGERRFVAVVEFEQSRFLVGGTSASLVLLARLGNPQDENESESDLGVARTENQPTDLSMGTPN